MSKDQTKLFNEMYSTELVNVVARVRDLANRFKMLEEVQE